tara:strand:- start:5789 stop:6940 length:1152 start_codon:yes stop_codon:yes gene_type:complete
MKTLIKLIYIIFFTFFFNHVVFSNDKIKIGLLAPLTGEYSDIGKSIVNSVRLALNSIDNDRLEIILRDTKSNPDKTLIAAQDLSKNHNIKIIIGPVFYSSTKFLNELPDVIFLSFTNILENKHSNVISSGVNSISQINAIKKFQNIKGLEKTIFLIPDTSYKSEIEKAILETKIVLKNSFIYNTDPTLLTSQIEKITKYPQRKQNLLDEIKRIENSDEVNKDNILENLKKRDTMGNLNFDSVIIADFDENLKSVTTSLLYTDVSSKRVSYISLNQWFDKTLLKEKALQPMYFPSIDKKNYDDFVILYEENFKDTPNQISFLSYDLIGLIYYLVYKNDFVIDKKIFYKKNKFRGKIGIFEIDKNIITHNLSFYSVEKGEFKKIF